MTEKFLHYVWQHSHYNSASLCTIGGEPVQVIHPGLYNTNQGPDFLDARIRIGNTVLAGSVEIHIYSSDWLKHGHGGDENYNNVVLHVVLEHDTLIGLPEVELQGRIPRKMIEQYESMMQNGHSLPCATSISNIKELTWTAWKERLLIERLEKRKGFILQMLQQNKQHWEETLWWLLCRNLGGTINGDAFEQLARSLHPNLLAKHKENVLQLEALLFGQAGLLIETPDKYSMMLQKEYQFLRKKYHLQPVALNMQFLRMRPGNFPTVRLAQLAMIIRHSHHLFSLIIEHHDLSVLMKTLQVEANDYWHYHYRFGEEGNFHPKKLGTDTVRNILINTVVPILYTYGTVKKEERFVSKALRWLQELPGECNVVIKEYGSLGVRTASAFDSQALLELKKNYCNEKHCLRCAVGNALLKSDFHS